MLKAAGVDQLSIGERLKSFDADHIEHLSRLYQKQAAVVARHVDELRFVENHLLGTGWSDELDDRLTAELPLDDAGLARMQSPVDHSIVAADVIRARTKSPFAITSMLAALVLIRNGWMSNFDEVEIGLQALGHGDVKTADEGALAFGSWRALHLPMALLPTQQLIGALIDCTRKDDAAIALRLIGEDDEVDPALGASTDPDRAFSAALALQQPEPLRAALGYPDRRYAAAKALAKGGFGSLLREVLLDLDDDDQLEAVLGALRRHKQAFPELNATLWKLTTGHTRSVRDSATFLLGLENREGDSTALITLDSDDERAISAALDRASGEPLELERLARWLISRQKFTLDQTGVRDAVLTGGLPLDLIPSSIESSVGSEHHVQLLKVAGEQLVATNAESLHRFLLHTTWQHLPLVVRSEAWSCLVGWYGQTDYPTGGPLVLDDSIIREFFGDVDQFVDRFVETTRVVGLEEVHSLCDMIDLLLRYSPPEGIRTLINQKALFKRFLDGVNQLLGDELLPLQLRVSAIRFLETVANVEPDLASNMLGFLDHMEATFAGSPMEFECAAAASRIRDE